MLTDSSAVYGRISQILHWLMAFYLIRQAVAVIAWRVDEEGNNLIAELTSGLHAPTGVAILVLAIVRLGWAVSQRRHRPHRSGLSGRLVVAGHCALYVLMLVLPITGLLTRWGEGKRLEAYGVLLFDAGPKIEWAETLGRALHQPLGWLLIVMMTGHVAAALFHQFVLRDGTLKRMIGRDRRSSRGGLTLRKSSNSSSNKMHN